MDRADATFALTAFLDTNVLIRHLTGDPPAMARRATTFLARADTLLLTDVVLAECVYVLDSFYEAPRPQVAELMRSALALPAIRVADADVLLRALELYELHNLGYADAYLVACAELSGIGAVATFDAELARRSSVEALTP